jgi:hypothetical protein
MDANLDRCDLAGACGPVETWLEIGCNGPDDCAGGSCCGAFQNNSYSTLECKPQCGQGELTMCFGAPDVCPQGTDCNDSQVLGDGYSVCF